MLLAVEILLAQRARDAVVDALGARRHVRPRVHHADLVVEALGVDFARAQGGDGFARLGDEIVLLGFREARHVLGQDLGDATDARADDVEAAAGGFDDDGAKGFGERRVQVDVAAHHDGADFLVAHGAEQLDFVLQQVSLQHLFEIDGFGARAGDDEAHVGIEGEDARESGDEEVRAFVVEEAGNDYDGDGGMCVQRRTGRRGWRDGGSGCWVAGGDGC